MEQFMDFLMQRAAQQQAPAPQTQQQKAVIDKNYERVRKQGANVFQGTTDPADAEEWLRNTERVKKLEFLQFKQNDMLVAEYEVQFLVQAEAEEEVVEEV
ncbi:uncharacterized protein LOC125369314 [Ricinus communis]|uniref:uncharacterized protein LOC125369314 n=1 Tax=Ricinus communis TaxID=3988 RepID=UPI00201A8700|nr:uncharacterized protein LOC125369314 [Ricinus communis]